MSQIWTQNQAKQDDWPEENPEEMSHISDSNYHEGRTLPLSPPVCLSTCTLFPPNKHFTCFTTCRLCGNSFLQSRRARALSLVTGLVARIQCSHCCSLTSISGRELKSCFKPLQAKATRDHSEGHEYRNMRAHES